LESKKTSSEDKDFLKTLDRGLAVIKSFDSETPSMTLTKVARKNGMSRASARRFLKTLSRLGYVLQVGNTYQLTARILDIAYCYLNNLDFLDVITPIMREVNRKLGKACSIAVLDGEDVVYIARAHATQKILSVNLQVGSRLPAFCTSMGRVLLATLPENRREEFLRDAKLKAYTAHTITDPDRLRELLHQVKQDGYAIVDQELEESLCAMAIPIHNRAGIVVCAMNVGLPASQIAIGDLIDTHLPVLKDAAQKAEQLLAHH